MSDRGVSPLSPSTGAPKARPPTFGSAELVPLFYAALLFLAGIVAVHFCPLQAGPLLAGLFPLAFVSGWAIWKAPRVAWLPLAALWLVLGAWSGESEPEPAISPAIMSLSDGLLRTVEGTVISSGSLHKAEQEEEADSPGDSPVESSRAGLTQRVDLQVTAAEVVTDDSDAVLPIAKSATGGLRLTIAWPSAVPPAIRCGQRIRAVVRMLPPDAFHDPGVWNRAVYLEGQGIAASAKVSGADADRFEILDGPARQSMACILNGLQQAASTRLESLPRLMRGFPSFLRVHPDDAAMLAALAAGDRGYLNRALRVGFERTGSFHLIVVSGLHLAILAGCVFAMARKLRLPNLAATAVTLAITLGYALFTGFAIPAQRSFWMIALYLLGRLIFRNRSPLNVVGFATLCMLAASPRSIFDASLQMTLLSVAAIAGVALPLLERSLKPLREATLDLHLIDIDVKSPPRIAEFRVLLRLFASRLTSAANRFAGWRLMPFAVRWTIRIAELVFIGTIVELALALPMAIYFHRITVYALPVNLVILPLLGILIPSAMVLLLVLSVWPAAALLPAAVCGVVLHLSVLIVRSLGAMAMGDLRIPEPGMAQTAAAFLLFILAVQLARATGAIRRIAFLALLLMGALAIWPRPIDHPGNALLFQAIDVGQGDSLLMITPDGKTILIDGGGEIAYGGNGSSLANSAAVPSLDIGEEVVSAVLWSRGIRHLDVVALTHAHQDHMGGLPAVLRNFHPGELWVGNNPLIPAYAALLREAAEQGTWVRSFRAGDSVMLGQVSIRVLAPQPGYQPQEQPKNDDSLVLQARYGATSILLTGDAEAPEEREILSEGDLQSTVLKVGHHGSLTSTGGEFLARVAPSWAVISCGIHNHFGHPRPEILTELQTDQVRTFRTDIDGTTCLLLDGKSVTAEPMCGKSELTLPGLVLKNP